MLPIGKACHIMECFNGFVGRAMPRLLHDVEETPSATLTAKEDLRLKMNQWATFAPSVQLLLLGRLAWDLAEQLDESKQVVSMLPASFAGRCMRQDADEEEAPLPSSSTTKLSQDTFSTPTKTACSSDSFSFMEEMETPEKVASSLPAACLDQEREVATETTPDTVDLTNEAEEVQAATADDVVEQAPPNHHESGEPEAPSFPSSGYTELDSEFGEAVLATSCQLASAKTRCAELESESSVLEAEGKQLKSELELMRKQLSDEMQKREPHEPLPE